MAKKFEESPKFISSVCEHVSCKVVCLSWRRMSGLPNWCNTPEEEGQNIYIIKLSRVL